MIDFTLPKEQLSWRISNDTVMGGESQGNISFEPDHAIFSGDISLANNGGFSAVFHVVQTLSHKVNAVRAEIIGDGHRYQIRIVSNINGKQISYFHKVDTVIGQRQTLTFDLARFQAIFRGRKMFNAPILKAEQITEVGFLLTTNQSTSFYLSIFDIDFIKAELR